MQATAQLRSLAKSSIVLLALILSACVMRAPKEAKVELPQSGNNPTLPDLFHGKVAPIVSSADDPIPGVAPVGIKAESGAEVPALPQSEVPQLALTGWNRSAADAIREARSQGKALLIAATNQQIENSQLFQNTFLASKEFREAAGDAFTLLLIDYGDKETAKSDYYRDFKARLNLRGYPTLIVTLPDGHELVRLKGYTTDWKGRYVQAIREAKPHVAQAVELRRKKMTASGYRLWSGSRGAQVFAKLDHVDANQAVFIGEWGEPFRTFITRLSEEDRKWIGDHTK